MENRNNNKERLVNKKEELTIVDFDHHFLEHHPEKLEELSILYCSIWERDDNFGEYMICPNHKKYFNWKQVEEEGITHCPDCKAKLEKAWNSNEVEEEILKVANSSGFYGFLVMDDKNKIQGFAWAEIMNIQEVLFKWGKEIHSELSDLISSAGSSDNNGEIIYFDELGLSRKYRNKGLGKVLVKRTCQSFSKKFPNTPSFLRTHKNSPAIHIYQKLGYDIVCDDTEFGDGRVILYTPKSKQLNLNF